MSDLSRKALVTGATGFIGSRLARRLVADGWEIHAIIRPMSALGQLEPVLPRMTLHPHDGTTRRMLDLVGGIGPEVVFHVGSCFISQHSSGDIDALAESNLRFGMQLLEAMATHGLHRLVNTGTSWQHHLNQRYNPVNLYAATKQAFETILQFYVESTPLRAITLKLFDTYGSGDPRGKLLSVLQRAAQSGETLRMSPGEQLVDLVHVDDVVEAYLLAAARLMAGECPGHEDYAVSSGDPLRLKDMVSAFCKHTGREITVEWGGRPYRPREVMTPWSEGKSLPGWRPRVPLSEGLRRLTEYR